MTYPLSTMMFYKRAIEDQTRDYTWNTREMNQRTCIGRHGKYAAAAADNEKLRACNAPSAAFRSKRRRIGLITSSSCARERHPPHSRSGAPRLLSSPLVYIARTIWVILLASA